MCTAVQTTGFDCCATLGDILIITTADVFTQRGVLSKCKYDAVLQNILYFAYKNSVQLHRSFRIILYRIYNEGDDL